MKSIGNDSCLILSPLSLSFGLWYCGWPQLELYLIERTEDTIYINISILAFTRYWTQFPWHLQQMAYPLCYNAPLEFELIYFMWFFIFTFVNIKKHYTKDGLIKKTIKVRPSTTKLHQLRTPYKTNFSFKHMHSC